MTAPELRAATLDFLHYGIAYVRSEADACVLHDTLYNAGHATTIRPSERGYAVVKAEKLRRVG